MAKNKYDIFISYRREGGRQYARILQQMLERRGYKVFLDYDEIVDGPFSPLIEAALIDAPVYIILLSKGALDKCVEEGNWVRREIELALAHNKHIIPVNPDNTFDGIPEGVPENLKKAIESIQYSEINFGQALNATVELMVKNRIKPHIRVRNRLIRVVSAAAIGVVAIAAIIFAWTWKKSCDLQDLKENITFNGASVKWAKDIDKKQLLAVRDIFESMKPMEGGTFMQGAMALEDGTFDERVEPEFEAPAFTAVVNPFYINKFEVSVGQWNAIMDDSREGEPSAPISNVTIAQAIDFVRKLSDLTTMEFRLPTETEWEYAAKGGNRPEGYIFAGSNNPADVAWYAANSHGYPHAQEPSDLPGTPTVDDLFNMSGNVSEWCNTHFEPYDKNQPPFGGEDAMVIRGGNYDSEEYEITVTHREPGDPDISVPTLGFRLALSK